MDPVSKTTEILTESECALILNYLVNNHSTARQYRNAIRNSCLFLLCLDAGLRAGEATQLSISCLFVSGSPVDAVLVPLHLAKNQSPRFVPTTARLKEAISRLNESVWIHAQTSPTTYAFFSKCPTHALTVRQFERIIFQAGLNSIKRNVWPHMLRHTFATRLMQQTSIRIVQELLGHKSITSTQIYTHPNTEDLQNAIAKIQ